MEYLNEDEFKDLDTFIESCTETAAAIGDLQTVTNSIDGMFMIPIRSSIVYVGELRSNGANDDLEYYQQCMDQGVELNEEELSHYHDLLAAYEEMQNNSK